MGDRTLKVSMSPDLAAQVEELARAQRRSPEEVMREAVRRYVELQRRWDAALEDAQSAATAAGLNSQEEIDAAVDEAVKQSRRERRGED
jgi:predicted transcriptional regulator